MLVYELLNITHTSLVNDSCLS